MKQQIENFGIHPGYRTASERPQSDETPNYDWTEGRVRSSAYYQCHVYRTALRLIKSKNLESAIDIGCGPGVKLMEILGPACRQSVGIDQKHAIEICRTRYPAGEFYVDDFDVPFLGLNRKFDLIICSDAIEHLSDPDRLLTYIESYAHPDSYIILSTPERDRQRGKGCSFSPKPEHIREWNSQEFASYLQSRSLAVIQHKIVPKMKWNFREYYKMLKTPTTFYNQLMSCQMVICRLASHV